MFNVFFFNVFFRPPPGNNKQSGLSIDEKYIRLFSPVISVIVLVLMKNNKMIISSYYIEQFFLHMSIGLNQFIFLPFESSIFSKERRGILVVFF